MIPLGPVVARSKVLAERATVWAYLVHQARRALWWPELDLRPQIGSAVTERWSEGDGDERVSRDASGEVDVVVPEYALGFRWKEAGDARETAVLITLRTLNEGTAVTVTETGFDSLTEAAARASASQEGWNILLADLAAAAEADTGDLEFPDEEEPAVEDSVPAEEPEPAEELEVDVNANPAADGDLTDNIDTAKDSVTTEEPGSTEEIERTEDIESPETAAPTHEAVQSDPRETEDAGLPDTNPIDTEPMGQVADQRAGSRAEPAGRAEASGTDNPSSLSGDPDFDDLIRGLR